MKGLLRMGSTKRDNPLTLGLYFFIKEIRRHRLTPYQIYFELAGETVLDAKGTFFFLKKINILFIDHFLLLNSALVPIRFECAQLRIHVHVHVYSLSLVIEADEIQQLKFTIFRKGQKH